MKLFTLELCNFRQFYDEQTILFSTDDAKNVTVIHGENGAGKTALLNAFKWVFYEEVDFDTGTSNLVNERAIDESDEKNEIHTYVCVNFEHDDKKYKIRRDLFCKKEGQLTCKPTGGSVMELSWIDQDGEFHKSPNPETHINQILPNRLHSYFFFNGERIEKLATLEASPDIKRAIKSVMGLEIIERASRHMDKQVIVRLKKELKSHSTEELSELIEKETNLSNRIQEKQQQIETRQANIRHYKTEISDINRRLQEITEVAKLQTKREELEADIIDMRNKIAEIKREKVQYLSKYGFLAYTDKLIDTATKILEEKRKKGELPSLIKSQFVDDLLNNEECICGRELTKGTKPYEKVASYKTSVTPDDVEDSFIKTAGAVNAMPEAKSELFDRIKSFQRQEKEYRVQIKTRHGQIDTIAKQLGEHEIEDVALLNEKREQINRDQETETLALGGDQDQLKRFKSEFDEVKKQRQALSLKGEKAELARTRLETAEEVKRVIDLLHDALSDKVRIDLSKRVNDTFQKIIRKQYWAEISNDYSLEIYKEVGGKKHLVADKSTGESQIASLSFIGSLISLAKERHASEAEYYKGGIFPIVMDSPYGSLDPEYGGKVAEAIPTLAEQVILMATNTQWKGAVQEAIAKKTGKEYTLMYHTTAESVETSTKSVVTGNKYEFTKVMEGYYE